MITRYRITLRSDHIEARGYVDGYANLLALAEALEPLGIVVARSPAPPDYVPWSPITAPTKVPPTVP